METIKDRFLKNGYADLDKLIPQKTIIELRNIYDALLSDKKRTIGLRSDLAGRNYIGAEDRRTSSEDKSTVPDRTIDNSQDAKPERITQIMRPSQIEPELLQSSVYASALDWAKKLLGEDMEMDFDMLINKAPHTDTPTPWHQDAAYWIAMPDKRAVSCWIALDDVYEENGCMWFIAKKSNPDILPHRNLPNGGALYCKTSTEGAEPVPLKAGGCTFHDGFTLHFSKGNTTSGPRRALILNFRPEKMIALERSQGVDHTGKRSFRK